MNSIYHQVLKVLRSGSRLVFATVIRTAGSTPQKPGSSALFGESGLIAGTVGGGQLEGEVEHIAKSVLISGVSNHYYFNLDSAQGEDGAICGGETIVLIDANPGIHLKSFEAMEQSLANRQGGYLLTKVGQGGENGRTIERQWIIPTGHDPLPADLDSSIADALINHIKKPVGQSFVVPGPQESLMEIDEMAYFESLKPLPHLVIAGGGHVGRALAHLGALLDFEVTIIDDRPEFANPDNIPDANQFVVQDVGQAMRALKAGPETYIVIVTRGHQHDAEALIPCIGSDAAYIGMIGSANKVAVIKKRFLSEGLTTPEQWANIHAPIGLPIGSQSVQEIAISIAAELVNVRSQIMRDNER